MSTVLLCKSIAYNIYYTYLNVRGVEKLDCRGMGNGGHEKVKMHSHLQVKRSFFSHVVTLFLFLIFMVNAVLSATQITGTVLDADSKAPLKNTLVSLKSTSDLVLTDESGKFTISPTAVTNQKVIRDENSKSIRIKNGILSLYVEKNNTKIEFKTYTLTGKQISSVSYILSIGSHSIAILNLRNAAGTILCKFKVNSQVYAFPLTPTLSFTITPALFNPVSSLRPNGFTASIVDTLVVSKYLYTPITTSVAATIYLKKPDALPPPPGMKAIPGGTNVRGSARTFSDNDEQPVKEITISPFFMDSTEVTQADFKSLLNVQSWADVVLPGCGNNYPAWNINWYDAALYCNARSKRDGLDTVYIYDGISGVAGDSCILENITTDFDKNGYRLPTESEWEFAARGGASTDYYWGNYTKQDLITPTTHAWYATNAANPIAMKLPNPYGLYDVAGNVCEWVNDYYSPNSYYSEEIIDPKGPSGGDQKVVRGGSWRLGIIQIRPADRLSYKLAMGLNYVGFRVILPNK